MRRTALHWQCHADWIAIAWWTKPEIKRWSLGGAARVHFISTKWKNFIGTKTETCIKLKMLLSARENWKRATGQRCNRPRHLKQLQKQCRPGLRKTASYAGATEVR